jgi:hypothetical protein
LREGLTVEQLRHVISVWELLVKTGKREGEHFGPVSPFRAGNVMQYVEMSLDDARKPRWQATQATRPPEPPKSPRVERHVGPLNFSIFGHLDPPNI